MHLSRFTSLLLGALVAALLLAGAAFVTHFTEIATALAAGFVSAFIAIITARMLEDPRTPPVAEHPLVQSTSAASGSRAHPPQRAAESIRSAPRQRSDASVSPARDSARDSGRNGSRDSSRDSEPGDTVVADGVRLSGNVKWFNRAKGYGFIHCDDGREVFVHHRNLRGEERQALQDGERVSFQIVERNRGPQAEDVAVEGE